MKAQTLYKYLDVKGALMMLHYSNLQFTNATRLNDPFDCHPALFDYSNAPVNEHNWPPADWLIMKEENDMLNLRNNTWVCSLSKIYNSPSMWAHYGNHKGVCIGLNMEKAHKYLSRIMCAIYTGAREIEVQYRDINAKPDYFHDVRDCLHYLLSTKAKEWEYEQEVRLVLIEPTPSWNYDIPFFAPMGLPYKPKNKRERIDWKEVRAYPRLGSECFESLYLGIKMDKEEKERIIKEARKCNPDIKILQMTEDQDALKLKEEIV